MEYYTSTLSLDTTMFVKRLVKPSLVENYEEAKKVEHDLESINKDYVEQEARTSGSKKHFLLTIPEEEHSNELKNMVQMV